VIVQKNLIQAVQKGSSYKARDKPTSGGVLCAVRWSEAVERNEVDGPFSTACKGR
jgi:hypothetical protein